MKQWIRQFLGINDLVSNQQMLYSEQAQLHDKLNAIKGQIVATNSSMDRLIAKLDPEHVASKSPNDAA